MVDNLNVPHLFHPTFHYKATRSFAQLLALSPVSEQLAVMTSLLRSTTTTTPMFGMYAPDEIVT